MVGRRDVLLAGSACLMGATATAQTRPLLRKRIPSSGETLPVIGLGTARRYEDVRSEAELEPLRETLAAFHRGGGTVIDTAPTYGNAEQVIGRLVAELGIRPSLFLATKVSIAGQAEGRRQIEESFRALRTDRIDLIAVHNLRDTQAHLQTLRALKREGRIGYVGVTTSFKPQHDPLADLIARERLDFVQVDYALDNRNAERRILPLAQEHGTAVMLNLPFGRGRLFSEVRSQPLPPWAGEYGCASWPQIFLKYLVSHPAVTCVVPGMAKPEYVRDNLQAGREPMFPPEIRRMLEHTIDAL